MKQRSFEEQNAARWELFSRRVDELDLLGSKRSAGDRRTALSDFPDLYLCICRDLAVATERRYSPSLIDRLNRLALDGHRILYARDTNLAANAVRFFTRDFPRAVRRDSWTVAAATLLFLGPGLVLWILIGLAPELIYSVMDAASVRDFEAMYDPAAEHIGSNRAAEADVQMFGYYIMNNIGIAFRAYAGGIMLGVGSALILVFNGIQLGAVAAHIGRLGFESTFYSFVIGHGAFELTAIVLSGAAGLKLGISVIAPGARSRVASLRHAATESMTVVWGVFVMLVIAAVIEAFWSSKGALAVEVKFAVGAICWALVLAYFAFVGRRERFRVDHA